jgi:hypothetical protein
LNYLPASDSWNRIFAAYGTKNLIVGFTGLNKVVELDFNALFNSPVYNRSDIEGPACSGIASQSRVGKSLYVVID